MSSDYGALSLLPPLFAIGLAIWTKQVYLALMTGIWLGWTIVDGFHPGDRPLSFDRSARRSLPRRRPLLPISDSTIVSSMAACTDHIDHVRTQLPYALTAAGITIALYVVLGVLLS